jgi:hypothetical protein
LRTAEDVRAEEAVSELDAELAEVEREVQADDYDEWRSLGTGAAWTYHVGVALLGLGVASILAPLSTASASDAVMRWAAAGVVVCAVAMNVIVTVRRALRVLDDIPMAALSHFG